MLNLTKEEKLVLVFLVASFLIGSGVNFYKKAFDSERKILDTSRAISYKKPASNKININRAGFAELIKLKGIGGKTAIQIIDYRKANGPFFYKEDLMKVKGIGKSKFDTIKDKIITE